MTAPNPRTLRMSKEIDMLMKSPPHGISCWAKNETLDRLEAGTLSIFNIKPLYLMPSLLQLFKEVLAALMRTAIFILI